MSSKLILLAILLLCISATTVHAEDPLATSGEILAAEGNPDARNFGDSSASSRLRGADDFQVDLYTGSATYTYPIEVPPGTNGLAPSLALVYNSQNTKGTSNWLGAGWSLSGLSRIERNTKDGVPNYDGTDTYVLDGEDLIDIGGNEYKTEIDSYRKIVNNGNYWTLFDKSGTQYRYGYNTDSKIEAVGKGGAVRTWSLDKITDTHGNSIEISYSEDTANGDFYPSKITYNTGNSQTTFRTIDFILEDRPDTSIDYRFGSIVKEDKRLKRIEVKHGIQLVRKYEFTYAQSQNNKRSLLKSIQVFGSDGSSTLPSTEFTYQTHENSWTTEGGSWSWYAEWGTDGSIEDGYPYTDPEGGSSINSDGIWDIDISFKDILDRYIAVSGGDDIRIQESTEWGRTVDINGDGWDDLVTNDGQVYLNERNQGWSRDSSWDLPIEFSYNGKDLGVRMVDANGDGLTDILRDYQSVLLNDGTGWTESGYGVPTLFAIDGQETGVRFGDIDGDGLLDIIKAYHYYLDSVSPCPLNDTIYGGTKKHTYNYFVWINTGNGWTNVNNGDWSDTEAWSCETGEITYSHSGDTLANEDGIWDIPDFILFNDRGSLKEQGRLTDVNGDGLADFIGNSGESVYLNNGYGWDSDPITGGIQPAPGWTIPEPFYDGTNDLGVRLIDMNSDGRVDLLTNSKIYLNNGSGWYYDGWDSPVGSLVKSLSGTTHGLGVSFVDINGDGSTDIIKSLEYRVWFDYLDGRGTQDFSYYYQLWFGESKIPDLLSSVKSSTGGRTDIVYNSSSEYDNRGGDSLWDVSFSLPVVSSVITDNGMTGSQQSIDTYSYEYANGMYDRDSKEFRGFGYVKVTDPVGTTVEHYFHQDGGRKGRAYDTQVKDSSGNPYTKTENTWGSSISSGVYTVTLDKTLQYTYDGVLSDPKITDTRYYYDNYGNVIKTSYLGDTTSSSDDLEVTSDYYPNINTWIVDRVARVILKDSAGQDVAKRWYYYDDSTAWNTAPLSKGELTKEENWLSTGTNPVTEYGYDSYGNQITVTDSNGYSTFYEYDVITHIFPERIINAKGQSTDYTYDLGTGNLLSTTDSNGFMTSYEYDVFGRIINEVRPYDSSSYPTKTYTYSLDGTAPESVKVSQREQTGTTNTLDVYTFVDGIGRTIQTKTDAEDLSKQIVADTFYNEIGSVENQSIPYLAAKSAVYVQPDMTQRSTDLEYDPIGRNILVRNTDDTVKTTAFDHWKTSSTDENGHQKVYYLDAYGRIKQVDEKNQGSTYTTTYGYDALDNLVKITDAYGNVFSFDYDSLGRKLGVDDPDMGVWNYSYDGVGNLIEQKDAKGTVIVFGYDVLNRVTLKDHPTDGDITYTYDAETIGTLSEVGSSDSTTHYYYDQRLRTIKEVMQMDGITQTTEWSYDSADRVTSQTNPSGDVLTFGYNSQGETETVGNVITNIDYNALNKVARRDYGNSKTTTLAYNADDFRLNRILTSGLQDMQYDYDNVGNVISRTNTLDSTTETFGYGALDRLTSAVETGGYSRSYVYDSVGNILSLNDSGDVTDFTYGSGAGPHAVTWWSRDTTASTLIIDSPTNETITDITPDLNVTVGKQANITYSWNGGITVSGCRSCDSYSTVYGESAPETGTSLLLHLNEDFGDRVYDDSGYSNDGLLVNGAGWAAGRFGYGVKLDGVDDGIDVVYDSSLDILDEDDGGKPFAFGVWFKLGVGALSSKNVILSQQDGAGTGRTWVQVRGNDDRLVSWLGYDGVTNHGVVSNTTVTEDRWYFVVITFNGTDLDLYVNGTFDTGVADTSVDENADGDYLFGRTKNLGNYFDGTIDEVMFFNRSLSAAEIRELYNRTLPDGQHNVAVYANDTTGNLGSAMRWFTVSALSGVAIISPLNDTIADITPDLNVTVGKQADVTYSWDGKSNISGCRSCDSYNAAYGEYIDTGGQNLVLAMRFNENFGDKVFDDSIYAHNGSFQAVAPSTGLPDWATGKFGGGLYFNNSGNDMFVNVSDVDDGLEFGYGEDFTVMAWVKTGSDKSFGSWQYLINKAKSDNGWHFYIDYSGGKGTPGAMIHRSEGVDHMVSGVTSVNDSRWHHVAWVVNWSYSVLYVDGERDATTSISGFPGAYSPDYTPYRIGQRLNSATLDELLVFNRSLSDLEISKIYNKNLPDGQHNVTVYAMDVEGNKDSATRYFTVG